MAVKGSTKAGAKYIRRKKVKGKWQYTYTEPPKKKRIKKLSIKKPIVKKKPKLTIIKKKVKPKIKDFYREGIHKYFDTGAKKKEFLRKQKLGMAGGKGQKISTAERIKIGTAVAFDFGGEKQTGRVIATDGTKSRAPEHFDIQFISNGKTYIKKGVPKEAVGRKGKSWAQQQKEKAKKKITDMQLEARVMETRAVSEDVKMQAQELVRANWDIFEKVAGKYYNTRIKGGWDARKFGFEQEDLKMEAAIVVMKAAQSYLVNKPKDKRATFKTYVLSFLKADLAAALAVGSGAGGHLKASAKNQMYLWFFKDTLDEYKSAHKDAIPSDTEMLNFLEKKRKGLENIKGNRTFISYPWTIEKVRNAKKQSKKMESLQRLIENPKAGTAATMQSILNDEEVETFGHYRIDPWVETQKVVVKDGVGQALNRVFKDRMDREILKRRFGLFIDENSPASLRRYAQGWNSGEVADYLTKAERRKGSKKTWTPGDVNKREIQLLTKLGEDVQFQKEMKDFVKSENKADKEWPDAGLLVYWISLYKVIEQTISDYFPNFLDNYNEPKGEGSLDEGQEIEQYLKDSKSKSGSEKAINIGFKI